MMTRSTRMIHRCILLLAITGCLAIPVQSAVAGTTVPRQIQIKSIDFENGLIELFNFGPADMSLDRWRFCTHDFNQFRVYTGANGMNGLTIESNTSLFVHFNNDAPAADPDRVNRSTLGAFATALDQDAYGMQLYFPDQNGNIAFGNSALIADHLQWNIDGGSVGQAQQRSAQAVSEGLWSSINAFIVTEADSRRIDLIDLSGDELGSPPEYSVTPDTPPCPADIADTDSPDPDGTVNVFDLLEVLANWGTNGNGAAISAEGGGTEIVDVFDLLDLLAAWGDC